jgi:hypothetical protein
MHKFALMLFSPGFDEIPEFQAKNNPNIFILC